MKKLRNILRGFAGNNRGAGIVVVLVSMVCVALMGASILFMSYTAVRLKATERQASKDFYSAETAVEEIRAGVQAVALEAIATSYKYALETYSTGLGIADRFSDQFYADLKDADLFNDATSTQNRVNLLQSYVSNSSATVSDSVRVVKNPVEKTLVLKNVQVTYTAENDYKTTISTDISVGVPAFAYIMSATSISGLPEHALIAREALAQKDGSTSILKIYGSAYTGRMDLGGESGSKMTISEGNLVCAGDANISGATDRGRLVTVPAIDGTPVKFWAGRITVNQGSSVHLNSETRVLDDLELAERGASATLIDSYYGFGDGTSDSGVINTANRSSAILVNGMNSTLDVSGLSRLMLAGRAYISDTLFPNSKAMEDRSNSVSMLESVSVRPNQQMYLIDPKYLSGVSENPYVGSLDETVVLNEEGLKLLEKYPFELRTLRHSVPGDQNGTQIYYFFMEFDTSGRANEYFEEYFSLSSAEMNNYLGANSNLNALGTNTPGYTLRGEDGNYVISKPNNSVEFDCTGMRSTFNQLKKTLIDFNTEADASDPYEYIVHTAKVDAINGISTFALASDPEKVVAIVVDDEEDEGFTLSADDGYPDLRMIISNGDITVRRNFTGLVISGGTINISGNVTMSAEPDLVKEAFNAKNAAGEWFGDYLLHGGKESIGEEEDPDDVNGWNLNNLVTYKNWTKN